MKYKIIKAKRQYKDSLFRFLFGNEEYKNFTLDLYNAVNGSNYTNPEDIHITTLNDVIYMNIKNDVSFLFTGEMNFYEHQSTFNPNMPVRILIYAGRVYNKYIHDNKLDIYSSSEIRLPVPKCICFYNGNNKIKDKTILRLSDSFSDTDDKTDIEVKVTMLNINYGNNRKLLKACKPLAEYSYFVKCIRKNLNRTNDLKQSISESIDMMPDDYVLKPILNSHRAEVMDMCVLEYTQEKADEFHKAEINRLKDEALKEKNRADDAEKRADNAEKATKNLIAFLKNSGKTDDENKEILHQYNV